MPPQIGGFISDEVYDGLLESNPLHPVTSNTIACHFIDVLDGSEKSNKTSFVVCSLFCTFFSCISITINYRMLKKWKQLYCWSNICKRLARILE